MKGRPLPPTPEIIDSKYIDYSRCEATVNLTNATANFHMLGNYINGSDIIPVVKANAYGHGDRELSLAFSKLGATTYAVSNISEALSLRDALPLADIIILGHTSPKYRHTLSACNLIQTVHSAEYARALSQDMPQSSIRAYFAVDTGMTRLGWNVDNAHELLTTISTSVFTPYGIFTHLSSADGEYDEDVEFTSRQIDDFARVAHSVKSHFPNVVLHCAASSGALKYPKGVFDGVRLGLCLYGVATCKTKLALAPVMTFSCSIAQIKQLAPYTPVSYGRSYITRRATRVAVLTAGYADGIPRALSNRGAFYINGQRAPILGRVTMDQCIVDVTDIECKTSDTCTLFGSNAPSVSSVAELSDTIPYELLCRVSSRVPRRYVY